jgi:hypothetical protein
MKCKIFLLSGCLLAGFLTQAQFAKGDKLFGGSFAGYFQFYDQTVRQSSSNVGFIPSFGWFIKDNLAMGVRGGLSVSASRNAASIPTYKTNAIGFTPGVFLAKYKTLKEKFGLRMMHELYASYFRQRTANGTTTTKTISSGVTYNFTPGVFYRFSKNFMGEASIGGLFAAYSKSGDSKSYSMGANFLQGFNLGINYVMAKR